MSGEELPLSMLLSVCYFVSSEDALGFMKVKVRRTWKGRWGVVEGRLQVTDCSDINILIQSNGLGLVRTPAFSRNSEGEFSQYIFSNS
jgi:hypothetical protein